VNELHGYAQATRIGRTCSDLRSVISDQKSDQNVADSEH